MGKFIILLLINWLVGCICYYIKYKELSLMIIIASFFIGWMMPGICWGFELMFKFFDFLDNIKIIKK